MAKRIADKELTDRNWDQEEEGEEAGTFSIASVDVLKNRPIKKAKRRNIGESENPGAFKGFKGFSLTSSTSSAAAPTTGFSGFGNGGGFKGLAGLSNGSTPFGGFSSTTAPGLTFNGPASSSSTTAGDVTTNGSAPSSTQSPGALGSGISGGGSGAVGNNKEYSRQLTALNCSVRDWIVKHVNGNPLCDLNPIFRDYEQHLASIERKYGATAAAATDGGSHGNAPGGEKQAGGALPASSSSSSSSSSADASPSSSSSSSSAAAAALPSFSSPAAGAPLKTPVSLFSFGRDGAADKGSSPAGAAPVPAGVTFNFGQKLDSAALGPLASGGGGTGAPPSFSFSSAPGQSSLFGGATAAASALPFSFGGAKAEAAQPSTTDENGEEDSDEPPKVEVREIKEKDAFYSQRCKLFYKKDAEFKEKGVGTLHLKPTAEGRTQLVIRADTNLGNILLNIVLAPSMPSSRVGKNNVVLACVPNPPVDPKSPAVPMPMLIRVKTTEDADALYKILEEKKA
ncbi:nuclear pore complex protein Nup50 [Gadus morhua]|uniref:RanBD1 domain-containing protein n=1 Tax=Gadus morhua TaxID=8049 RepID=A0A8C5F3J0_GADMO|nr:nuclear pore complex protein Nup50 [Gadus morhua]